MSDRAPAEASPTVPSRPGWARRAAAGAWHVPAGFGIVLRTPRLWPLAALPAILTLLLMFLGAVLGFFVGARVEPMLAPAPGAQPVWIELPISLLLWTAMIGAGVFLGLGLALLLASPLLEQLSRQVERRVRGVAPDRGRGLIREIAESMRGGLYFLVAAPGVFLLGLIPLVGPFLSLMWGGRALAFQMTDPALTRRGLTFAAKRRWHREWLPESQGFGLAGMIGLLVPFAQLLLGPALVAGGTLLVLSVEPLAAESTRGTPTRTERTKEAAPNELEPGPPGDGAHVAAERPRD